MITAKSGSSSVLLAWYLPEIESFSQIYEHPSHVPWGDYRDNLTVAVGRPCRARHRSAVTIGLGKLVRSNPGLAPYDHEASFLLASVTHIKST